MEQIDAMKIIFMSIQFRPMAVAQWYNCRLIVPKVEGLRPSQTFVLIEKNREIVYKVQGSVSLCSLLLAFMFPV